MARGLTAEPFTEDTVDRYGVMGYPVAHSASPIIHRMFAAQTNQRLRYERLQVAPDKLSQAIAQFLRTGGKGLNITVPHKQAVCRIADQLSERASRAGAVNTLAFEDGEIFGDNTDGVGLVRDLEDNLSIHLQGLRILILGAGGATRGILGALLERRPEAVWIANRTVARAETLASEFAAEGAIFATGFDSVPGEPFDLVLNATSAGVRGETPPYPAGAVSATTLCYDLSYALSPTPFARWARDQGAGNAVMGWGMLVEQAAESFHIWRGVRPDTGPVLRQIVIGD